MPDRLRALISLSAAVALLAVPLVARADDPAPGASASRLSLNFQVPKGWADTTRPTDRAGYWREWAIRDGNAVHSLVMSVTRESSRAAAYGAAAAAQLASMPGSSQMTSGATTTCGDVPAFQYTYRTDRTPDHPLIIRHVLVDIGTLVGDLSYARPPDAADRQDALDAISTFCERHIYRAEAPAGWKALMMSVGEAGLGMFSSPSGDSTVMAMGVPMPVRAAEAMAGATMVKNGATLISDADEVCGSIHVRHARWRSVNAKGPQVFESVGGYHLGVRYVYTYERPESAPPDPGAEHVLTSFCDQAAPAPEPSNTPA